MSRVVDLSHPIAATACALGTADKVPAVTFEEGESHGLFLITSRIDNFYSRAGTQIDFPGRLPGMENSSARVRPTFATVGDYPLERFIGTVAVLDFSEKMKVLDSWFDIRGMFKRDQLQDFDDFIASFDELEISRGELMAKLSEVGAALETLTGVLIYSGSSGYWTNEVLEPWEYRYFYAPYLSTGAIQALIENDAISLVGTDAFQLEDPVANFRGDELPLMVNTGARAHVFARLSSWNGLSNHEGLLGNGILIYKSLRLSTAVANTVGEFSGPPLNLQLPGLDTDGPTRPYFVVNE